MNGNLISGLSSVHAGELIENGIINGGMIPKIHAGYDALRGGVNAVHFIDGNLEYSVLRQLCSDGSIGTELLFSSGNPAVRIQA
jgi:acetylglutamate kinase